MASMRHNGVTACLVLLVSCSSADPFRPELADVTGSWAGVVNGMLVRVQMTEGSEDIFTEIDGTALTVLAGDSTTFILGSGSQRNNVSVILELLNIAACYNFSGAFTQTNRIEGQWATCADPGNASALVLNR